MTTKKPDSLETFVERHRADFDVHEPRPDLWDALAAQLDGAEATVPAMRIVADEADAVAAPLAEKVLLAEKATPAAQPVVRPSLLQRYGIAAALALLVLAAGASEVWKTKGATEEVATASTLPNAAAPASADAPLYQSSNPTALAAAERNDLTDSRLDTAVRGMENYYAAQLSERQNQLRQLGDTATGSIPLDWQRELVSLDSSYRQLKLELPHHPQPEVVLTAMNRNLQIRLDILDQQLQTRTIADATSVAPSGFVLADSRRQP
jgi:hypothetical protein